MASSGHGRQTSVFTLGRLPSVLFLRYLTEVKGPRPSSPPHHHPSVSAVASADSHASSFVLLPTTDLDQTREPNLGGLTRSSLFHLFDLLTDSPFCLRTPPPAEKTLRDLFLDPLLEHKAGRCKFNRRQCDAETETRRGGRGEAWECADVL